MAEYIDFNGGKYYKQANGYYKGTAGWLHIEVWKVARGAIPEGCEIHHIDGNPANNELENLQLVTIAEHKRIHAVLRPKHEHICENCGKTYTATNFTGKNRFCSRTCRIAYLRKQGYYDVKKICEYCGAEFITRSDRKVRYCSKSCAKKAEPNKRRRANGQFAKNSETVECSLTAEQKAWIRAVHKSKDREYGATALARKFGVNRQTISRVVNAE